MGICLDTDQQNGSQVLEEAGAQNAEKWRKEAGILATPPGGNFPMRNSGAVRFEPPTVPVIFVLGGPGSGKVTHCDNLTQEKKGIVHINMTDLLQQYALGNEMQDFGLLSSKTVTEVLMLEMKMSPGAKTFLVSGYPRNMRDVVEYSEKIQIVNGVILVAWRQEVLEGQIDYGARLGQVIIELARMELQNFFKNVMPVAEYFDQSEMLLMVNGERNPSEVYVDFREAVMRILGLSDEAAAAPPRQVSSSLEAEVDVERQPHEQPERLQSSGPSRARAKQQQQVQSRNGLPPIIWVLGGPGSNKATVCSQATRSMSNWLHLSMGSLLVTVSASEASVRDALLAGELVPSDLVLQLLEQQILMNGDANGIVIDGFPRDFEQAAEFEAKFNVRPHMLLLDVSKQQPKRGRIYDSAEAFERRLVLFREQSLPMLKSLDRQGRLSIVEGDTDLPADRQQFAKALLELMRRETRIEDDPNRISLLDTRMQEPKSTKHKPNGLANGLQPAHRPDEAILGNGVAGGRKANGTASMREAAGKVMANNRQNGQSKQHKPTTNGTAHLLQNGLANGFLAQANNRVAPLAVEPLRQMYSELEAAPPVNLHM